VTAVDMELSDEQASVAAAIQDLLDSVSPVGRVRGLGSAGPVGDPELWKLAAEQGWFGLDLPEDAGGAGLGLPEQTLLFRELGRHLTAGPFAGTAIAAQALFAAGRQDLVQRIVQGDYRVGLCEPLGDACLDNLVGRSLLTYDADNVDAYLYVDRGGSAVLDATDVTVVLRKPSIDNASRWAELRSDTEPLATVPASDFDALVYGQVLISAMLAGIARETARQSAEYAKIREQFGVPIGSFQAVQHRCAEQAIRGQAALELVTLAGLSIASGGDSPELLAASAALLSADYALANCADNIQNHGGIGYTDEHDAHLFLKRSHVLALTLGDATARRQAVLDAPLRRR
jgi:alkylation response protein AidB-like acyl-CoA dehydrogenase